MLILPNSNTQRHALMSVVSALEVSINAWALSYGMQSQNLHSWLKKPKSNLGYPLTCQLLRALEASGVIFTQRGFMFHKVFYETENEKGQVVSLPAPLMHFPQEESTTNALAVRG